ncbi:putative retrotransposon protein, partial [Trifolium medium]|nr:putative retrotransposon protein [Trifolium medium]
MSMKPDSVIWGASLALVNFLGHVISKEGIAVDPAMIETVLSWKQPQTVTD